MSRHGRSSRKLADGSTPQSGHKNKYADLKHGGGKEGKKQRQKETGAWFSEHRHSSVGKQLLEQTAADAAEAETSQPVSLPSTDYFGFAVYPDGSFKVSSRNNQSEIAWVSGNFGDYNYLTRRAQVQFRFGGDDYGSLGDAERVAQVNGWRRARDELKTIETLLERKRGDFMRRHQETRPETNRTDKYRFPIEEVITESSFFNVSGSGTSPIGVHVSSLTPHSQIINASYIPRYPSPQIRILSQTSRMDFESFQAAEAAYEGNNNALREIDAIKLLMRDRGAKI